MKYLSGTAAAARLNIAALSQRVTRQGGPGAYRQVLDTLLLRLRGTGINVEEYYSFGLWRKDLDPDFLAQFLPDIHRPAFNGALLMPGNGLAGDVIENKVATEVVLRRAGLPTTLTLAAFTKQPVADHVVHLSDAAAIRRFLANPDIFPLFAKPQNDSHARGAVAMLCVAPDGQTVTLLNGVQASVAALADEIVADWSDGYIFQPFYQCHASLRKHVGPAMASPRIVTLLTESGVEPYYAMLRVPSKTAMHDGDSVNPRVWGLIDPQSGKMEKLRTLRDPLSPDVTHWLDPTEPLVGFELPNWHQALAAARKAHESFPGHGILGWDVFLTDSGPLINEVNANPGHIYQVAAARGLKNPDLAPLYARALAFAQSVNRRLIPA